MNPAPLTRGPVRGHLVRMSVPMVWALLAMMGFNLADTWFVSRLGPVELAAMSFTFPVVMLLVNLGIGLMSGTSSVVARAIGEGDLPGARRLATDAAVLGAGLSGILALAGLATLDPLFGALGAEGAALARVREYMVIWYLGLPLLLVPMAGMGAIRATGDAGSQGRIMAAAALLNLVLDPLLIFGLLGFPRLEMAGAATATVLARAATLGAGIWVLHRRHRLLDWRWPGGGVMLASWRRILHVALPAAGTNMIIPVSTAIVVALLAAEGPAAVAGFGAATRIEAVALIPFFALSAIVGPFAGQNLGAGRADRIAAAHALTGRFCVGAGLVLAAGLAAFAPGLGHAFSDDPEVVATAALYLRIVPWSYGAAGIVMIVNATFNGLGRPGPAVALSTARSLVLFVPLAYAGATLAGAAGIFAGACLANLAVGAAAWLWLARACARAGGPAVAPPRAGSRAEATP